MLWARLAGSEQARAARTGTMRRPIRRRLVGGIEGRQACAAGIGFSQSPGGQAQRAGPAGRRRQGSAPHGRDSARGAGGGNPRARRRDAGTQIKEQTPTKRSSLSEVIHRISIRNRINASGWLHLTEHNFCGIQLQHARACHGARQPNLSEFDHLIDYNLDII